MPRLAGSRSLPCLCSCQPLVERSQSRILSVLVAYPLGCALIGYAIDRVAGTRGIWVAMLFVGFVVAMWEVWKLSKQRPE